MIKSVTLDLLTSGDIREGRKYDEGLRASKCGMMLLKESNNLRGFVATPSKVLITTENEILEAAAGLGYSVVKVETFAKEDIEASWNKVKLGSHRRALGWMLGR